MYPFFKKIFDLSFSLAALTILLPFLILIALFILITSKGPVIYKQTRVGKNFRAFQILKFRTMKPGADQRGLLTIGSDDERITGAGKFLRRYKLDELLQLINVLKGDMTLVGPRPEVPEYITLYTDEQKKVLRVLPGITDEASLQYFNESDLLSKYQNAEEGYVKEVMPAKLEINLHYLENRSFLTDLGILLKTIARIFS